MCRIAPLTVCSVVYYVLRGVWMCSLHCGMRRGGWAQADESAVWKITRQVSHSLKQFLTKGCIVRLIHTEKEAHLTASHGDIDVRMDAGTSHDTVFLRDYDGAGALCVECVLWLECVWSVECVRCG